MASTSFSGQSNLGDEERVGFTDRPGRASSEDSKSDTKSDSGAEDEDENQKKELLRLLGTAKDEDRRRLVLSALSSLESKNKRIASLGHNFLTESMPVEAMSSGSGFVKSSSSHSLSSLAGNASSSGSGSVSTTIAIAEGKADDGAEDEERGKKGSMPANFNNSSINMSSSSSSSSANRLPVVMDDYKETDLNDVYNGPDGGQDYKSNDSIISGSSKMMEGGNGIINLSGAVKTLSMTRAVGMGANAGGVGTGLNRPMSARLRRSSLDVIPENRRFNLRTYEKGTELELEEHDVNDICSSSYDPKYPPSSNLLNQNSNKIGWMSTGLLPQVMSVNLSSLWVFRKVVVKCLGAERVHLSVPGTANVNIPMEKLNANEFIFDIRVTPLPLQIKHARKHGTDIMTSESSVLDLVFGNQVVLTFDASSTQFVAVVHLKIVVVPFIRGGSNDKTSVPAPELVETRPKLLPDVLINRGNRERK